MTTQHSQSSLKQRLEFIELDDTARKTMSEMRPVISSLIGGALDKFYGKIARTPAVAGFFSREVGKCWLIRRCASLARERRASSMRVSGK